MDLLFLGSGEFGLPTLRRLAAEHRVLAAVTRPERPAGRRRVPSPTPVARTAGDLGIPVIADEDVNRPDTVRRLRDLGAGALVVIAFGQKLGEELLAASLAINLHASLLPRYRGAAPVNWAIIRGETETGLSVIRMSGRIDAGDVLAQKATPIDPRETAGELEERLAAMAPPIVTGVLDAWRRGTLRPIAQDERLASRAPKLRKADGTVSFDQPAACVRNRVHGLSPWPGCRVQSGGTILRLARVEVASALGLEAAPGTVLPDGVVACRPGAVRLLEVQPPGGRIMPFGDYIRGHDPGSSGLRLEPL